MGEIKDRGKNWQFILNSIEKGDYTLKHNPVEWESTEYGMNREGDGLFFTFSGDYTHLKDGYDYIKDGLNQYGILWNCTLTIKAINNHTKVYDTIIYQKKLDFSSRPESNNNNGKNINISLTDSGFYEKILAYENEEIPYSRLESLDGTVITPYTNEYEDVTVYGQEIVSVGNGEFSLDDLQSYGAFYLFPKVTWEANNPNIKNTVLFYYLTEDQDSSAFFSYFSDGTISDVNLKLKLDYYMTSATTTPIIFTTFSVKKAKRLPENETNVEGNDIDLATVQTIFSQSVNAGGLVRVHNIIDIDINETLDADYGLYFEIFRSSPFLATTIEFQIESNELTKLDISAKAPETILEHVSLFQVHDRLITAMTGEADSFRSTVLDTGGDYAHLYASNGYLYRQFPATPTEPAIEGETTAQLSFKWKELQEEMALLPNPLAYGMIEEDGKKIIICEYRDYFYQDELVAVIADYKQGSFIRDVDIDQYYSGIKAGVKAKEYEEAGTLSDYSTIANYTSVLSVFENILDLTGKYQKSGNWVELSRRLVKTETETSDSKFDNDIVILETILDGVTRVQRTTEDFDQVNGIDQITTPVNLNLTPGRVVTGHGKWLNAGLSLYPDSKLTFNKSEIKTTLSTLRSDEGNIIYENTDINVSDLDLRKFTGDIIKVLADVKMTDVALAEASPYQKWQLVDEVTGDTVQGWIKSLSTKPIGEALTNIELWEAAEVTVTDNPILWNSGEAIIWVSGENINYNN